MTALTISFCLFMLMGLPISFVLAGSSLVYLLAGGDTDLLMVIPQKLYQGTDEFILLAIPFYLLAGELMNETGITQRLVGFFVIMMGHIRGALAHVNVVAGMFFSAISGTASSDAAAVGSVMIPSMIKQGYTPQFAAALQASTSTLGPIIPPSMVMIIYAVFANVSVAAMFAAGIVPGILLGLAQMALIAYYARDGRFPPAQVRSTRKEIQVGLKDATLAFLMPVLILGGIFGGIVTTTEAAAVAVVYAILVGSVFYRTLTWAGLRQALIRTSVSTGGLLLIATTGYLFGWVLAAEEVPSRAAEAIKLLSENRWVFLLLVNVALLLLGTFMDTLPTLIICVPVLFPIAQQLGVDPVHFGVLVCFNIVQGMLTPPVGILIFITSQIAKVSIESVTRAVLPFLILNTVVLFVLTFVPDLTLALPRAMGLLEAAPK